MKNTTRLLLSILISTTTPCAFAAPMELPRSIICVIDKNGSTYLVDIPATLTLGLDGDISKNTLSIDTGNIIVEVGALNRPMSEELKPLKVQSDSHVENVTSIKSAEFNLLVSTKLDGLSGGSALLAGYQRIGDKIQEVVCRMQPDSQNTMERGF